MDILTRHLDRSFKPGDIVFTDEEEFRSEWWWRWPGVVREVSELSDDVTVEFMGFAQLVTRRKKVLKKHLQILPDEETHARVYRVLHYLRLPTHKQVPEAPLGVKKHKPKEEAPPTVEEESAA